MQKWAQHREMVSKMTDIVRENGLFGLQAEEKMMRWMFASREEKSGKLWKAINNDNVLECQKMESNSVDLVVTSIPFPIITNIRRPITISGIMKATTSSSSRWTTSHQN